MMRLFPAQQLAMRDNIAHHALYANLFRASPEVERHPRRGTASEKEAGPRAGRVPENNQGNQKIMNPGNLH